MGFKGSDDMGPGIVGLLRRFQEGKPPPQSLEPWIRKVPNTETLWLLPAGPLASSEYWRQLSSISWKQLFFDSDSQGARFFQWLKEAMEEEFRPDHVMVDARTGVTEMGGAALSLMADQILALLGTSPEGIHGTREILRSVAGSSRAKEKGCPRMALVLARMPASLASPDLQSLRRAVRGKICQEAEPLTLTLDLELPLVVRSEPKLQEDERVALTDVDLRVHEDYQAILSWLKGGAVPEQAPGVQIPRDSSIEELKRGIALQQELAERLPETYLPDLASSLNKLSVSFLEMGRHEESLSAIEEAVEIRRSLAASRPDAFLPDLAMSLNNLSLRLGALGRREEALVAIEEAVKIRRSLAKSRPDAFLPDLAMSLNNLSLRLGALGRREEALVAIKEAVEHYRSLASSRPDAFLPDLAMSLNNLSNRYSDLDRHKDALAAIEKAMKHYQSLAESHPEAFLPQFGISLHNLSIHLNYYDRREEALATIKEAVAIWEKLVKKNPKTYYSNFVHSLFVLGCLQTDSAPKEAANTLEKGLEVLLPHLSKSKEAFSGLATKLLKEAKAARQNAGMDAENEIIREVSSILQISPDES
ncbi:MAG: tetratricopeptide repeat protein [Planctomycetota bacterium]|nr:MAG: tetratricopeptide repeat protein [Planctomycetota bacterium]